MCLDDFLITNLPIEFIKCKFGRLIGLNFINSTKSFPEMDSVLCLIFIEPKNACSVLIN